MEQDQQFVDFVIKAIVNHPDDVKTTRTVDERGVLITLDLNPGDMGYVIGRQGQTARAVRTLLRVVGAKNNARVNLKINEPEGGRGPAPRPAGAAPYAAPYASTPAAAPAPPASPVIEDIDTSAVENLNI